MYGSIDNPNLIKYVFCSDQVVSWLNFIPLAVENWVN